MAGSIGLRGLSLKGSGKYSGEGSTGSASSRSKESLEKRHHRGVDCRNARVPRKAVLLIG
jgi:hypothetical protein